jgi:hypothetical protein
MSWLMRCDVGVSVLYWVQSEEESVGGSVEGEGAAGHRRTRLRVGDEERRVEVGATGERHSSQATHSGYRNQESDLMGQAIEEAEGGGRAHEVEVQSRAENVEGPAGEAPPAQLVQEEDNVVGCFRRAVEEVLNRLQAEGVEVSLCGMSKDLGHLEAQLSDVAEHGELGKVWIADRLLPSLDALESVRLSDLQLDVRDLVTDLGGKATCPLSSDSSAYLRASTHHPTPPFILLCRRC